MRSFLKSFLKYLNQSKHMKQYDVAKENELLRKLVLLCIRRSMRPSMAENKQMYLILEQLYLLTEKDDYKL